MENFIIKALKKYAIQKEDEIAIEYGKEKISYSQLDKTTDYLSYKIKNIINDRVQIPIIIYQERGIKFIQYILAVLKCGCFYIPLEPNTPIERLKYIYDDSNSMLIVSDCNVSIGKEYNILSLDERNCKIQYSGCCENVRLDDLVYVMYTSGTMGKPKGVKIMYKNLFNLIESFGDILYSKFDKRINVGVLASFSFDASVKQIYCALYYGHKLCIAENSVKYFGRKIHKFHVNNELEVCDATPSHIKLMILQNTKIVSKVPYLLIGGEILRWELLKKYCEKYGFETTFLNVYGPTECCVDVAYKVIDMKLINDEKGIVPIGRSINNTQLLLKDEKDNVITKCNKKGELCIRGSQVGAGYVNVESKSFAIIDDVYEYKTGDIAYYNKNDEIIVIGRKDRQRKLKGNRIELDEIIYLIEKFLNCQAFVFVEKTKIEDEIIVAYICRNNFNQVEQRNLNNYLKSYLPCYMLPTKYFCGKNIPLTTNGKIDEKKIKQLCKVTS